MGGAEEVTACLNFAPAPYSSNTGRAPATDFAASATENCTLSRVAFDTISARGATIASTPDSSVNDNAPGTTSHRQHAAPR